MNRCVRCGNVFNPPYTYNDGATKHHSHSCSVCESQIQHGPGDFVQCNMNSYGYTWLKTPEGWLTCGRKEAL